MSVEGCVVITFNFSTPRSEDDDVEKFKIYLFIYDELRGCRFNASYWL